MYGKSDIKAKTVKLMKKISDLNDHRSHKNYCFACGKDNAEGMKLRFYYDQNRKRCVCNFRLNKRYTGPPGYCHGGIIATILDDAMSKMNKLREVVALTSQITVDLPSSGAISETFVRRVVRSTEARPQALQQSRDT